MARHKRNNRRRRKGSFAIVYKLLCLVLTVSAIVVALSLFFKVESVAVEGNERYSAQTVVAASGVEQDDNLFLMNKYDVAGRISDTLPYVEAVSIYRGLPDTLHIRIRECVCGVALEQDGRTWLLCSSGKMVDSEEGSATEGRVVVTGLYAQQPQVGTSLATDEQNEVAAHQLLEILAQLREKDMLKDVQEIHLENSSHITLRYLDRFNVEIPWGADFDYKLRFLIKVVAKLEDYETGTLRMMVDGEARLFAG